MRLLALLACRDPAPGRAPGEEPPPVDLDGDGFPVDLGDCDDLAADVFPGAAETCDGRDEDCDGQVDEGLVGAFYTDADGDGYGAPGTLGEGCLADGVLLGGDCDDADPQLHPEGDARFVDATAEVGLAPFLHWDPALTAMACANEQMSAGVAVGDVDGDGWPDVFLSRIGLPDVLLHNDGGTFTDMAALAGIEGVGHHSGAVMFDLEGDGDLDLYVLSLARDPHRLYVNDGSGVFSEEAAARGVDLAPPDDNPCRLNFGASAGDVDGDGDLDLHLTAWQEETSTTNDSARLFLNDGTGSFTDGTLPAGLDLRERATFTSTLLDVDDDLDLDVLAVADWNSSALFLNDGAGAFAETLSAGVGGDENGMGSAVGDPDGDGDPDWFVTAVYDDAVPPPEKWGTSGNRLYLNDGAGVFADGTELSGVRDGGWGWGASFLDHDLDGREDLVQVSGFPVPGFETSGSRLWRGLGDGRFEDRGCATGLVDRGQGRGVVPFDADLDGDPDVVVVGNGEVPRFWRNEQATGHHWLVVAVDPAEVGARVRVTTPSGTQTRWIVAGGSFVASGPPEARFGLADALSADVEVRWPDGTTSSWSAVPVDGPLSADR